MALRGEVLQTADKINASYVNTVLAMALWIPG
jgi:hypothetical protein